MKSTKEMPLDPDLRWQWHSLEQMQPVLLYDMLALRQAIFVVEQTCIYQDLDGLDKKALHLLAVHNEAVIACLRVLPPHGPETLVRIGRVAVSRHWRKQGIARVMMRKAIDKAQLDYSPAGVYLDAQTYLQKFYQSLGFRVRGKEFLEDGIAHIRMQLSV